MNEEKGGSMNPGITKLVALLNRFDFHTTDSGDGKTHDHECDRDYAYVSIVGWPDALIEQTQRLHLLMQAKDISIHAVNDEGKPYIQASYDPVNGFAIIDLVHVDDTMLPEGT